MILTAVSLLALVLTILRVLLATITLLLLLLIVCLLPAQQATCQRADNTRSTARLAVCRRRIVVRR